MLAALVLAALQAGTQARGPEVMVGVDRDRVAPGDVIEYTITVNSDLSDPIRVDLPTLGGFELEARTERSDVNMDGRAKYTGTGNDRDVILGNIGGVVPTNTRVEQLP